MRVPHFLVVALCMVLSSAVFAQSPDGYQNNLMPVPARGASFGHTAKTPTAGSA